MTNCKIPTKSACPETITFWNIFRTRQTFSGHFLDKPYKNQTFSITFSGHCFFVGFLTNSSGGHGPITCINMNGMRKLGNYLYRKIYISIINYSTFILVKPAVRVGVDDYDWVDSAIFNWLWQAIFINLFNKFQCFAKLLNNLKIFY